MCELDPRVVAALIASAIMLCLALVLGVIEWHASRRIRSRMLTQRARIDALDTRLTAVIGAARVLAAHIRDLDNRVEALVTAREESGRG